MNSAQHRTIHLSSMARLLKYGFSLHLLFIILSCNNIDPIVQNSYNYFQLDDTLLNFSADNNSTKVNIYSNHTWEASSSVSWLNIMPRQGVGNTEVTITVGNNSSISSRKSPIVFHSITSDMQTASVQMSIVQEGMDQSELNDSLIMLNFQQHLGDDVICWDINTPINQWEGVIVDYVYGNLIVKSIELSSLNLLHQDYGQIIQPFTEELLLLTDIDSLSFKSFNNVVFGGKFPENIGQLNQLKKLEIVGALFEGEIPSSIGQLQELETLILNNSLDKIEFPIPSEIRFLSKLKHLELTRFFTQNYFPSEVLELDSLHILSLNSSASIFTSMVDYFTHLNNLRHLELTFPSASLDNLPSSLENCSTLEKIELRLKIKNFPYKTLSSFQSLKSIEIYNSPFSDAILEKILNALNKDLDRLILNNIDLSGSLDSLLNDFLYLTYLDLSNNNLAGSITTEFLLQQPLSFLSLRNNNISGDLPYTLSQLPSLNYLDLRDNCFAGYLEKIWTDKQSVNWNFTPQKDGFGFITD